MEDFEDSSALDAGLLGGAQAVEHYEIARYGTLAAWAEQLGMTEAAQLLQQTLEEEKATDKALTQLAEAIINECGVREAAE
jgi:ferritin-like metal-binding protein YciE